jgi:hypothetical protein
MATKALRGSKSKGGVTRHRRKKATCHPGRKTY